MSEDFCSGYEHAKASFIYQNLSTEKLFELLSLYLKDYASDRNEYAFGQSKGITEILANRIIKRRVA